MSTIGRNPNDPIENLAIGKIIEVDGSHVVAELDPSIQELSRIYAGETYPIGQFGSIVKIHFGRRLIYGYVGRLRMKAEYDRELGLAASTTEDARIIEADLFGEAEWILDSAGNPPAWALQFERGVSTFPLPQQTMYLTPSSELRFIYGHGKGATLEIGVHVGSAGAPCYNEYATALKDCKSLSTDANTLSLPYWLLSSQETFSLFIGKTEFVATSQTNIIKIWQTAEERESNPILLICEEAHRYVPNRGEAQYEAAQEAIRRIAKEGRKYGLGLMLVSQRPSEVEETVLSQCNSWIVLRPSINSGRASPNLILINA